MNEASPQADPAQLSQTGRSVAEATSRNKSFSRQLPGLQLAVDSTSLGTFKECPRKYYYSVIQGWQPRQTSVHLEFGILVHGARERYDHRRAEGLSHEDALRAVVRWLLKASWNQALRRPKDFQHPRKHRLGLLRSMVLYLDKWGRDDPLKTVFLPNGKPAVELSFSFAIGLRTLSTDEEVMACGHLDRIADLDGTLYILDIKTTDHKIDAFWFKRFSPDNQFSMYTLAGNVVWDLPVAGVMVDGIQILADGIDTGRHLVPRGTALVQEWLKGLHWWHRQMEAAAVAGEWPMNDKSCGLYGGCPFRGVCAKPPAAREQWLATDFTRRVWDPLDRRGNPEG